MEEKIKCPICDLDAILISKSQTNGVKCPICGEFNIGSAFDIPKFSEDEKIKLRYYYYTTAKNNGELRLQSYITKSNKDEFLSKIKAPKTMLEKMDNIMNYLYKSSTSFGQNVSVDRRNGHRLFFCKDEKEFENILKDLENKEFVKTKPISILQVQDDNLKPIDREISLTSKGFEYIESKKHLNSTQCFIAMWFNRCTKGFYKASQETIENKTGYQVLKIDEYNHINYIPIEILEQIKNSRFLIADLTGHRGGVYYEAGYAEALGIPVIYTCRKDWFEDKKDQKGKIIQCGVHFDIRQKNIIMWQNNKLEQFQEKLLKTINDVIGLNKE